MMVTITGATTGGGMLRFGVLGPLLVNLDERPIELPTSMLRRLLAILLCQPGQPIPADLLLEALWDGQPPPTARKTLQIYVHRLRRALGEGQLPRGPAGYWIALENAEVDSTLFADLLREAGQAHDRQELPEAGRLYAMALKQWRGNAFADVIGCAHIASHARQLDEAHLHTIERLAEIELRLGHHADIIGWLTPATAAHPYHEKLREHLILGLYRSGRQADALAEYRRLRHQLVEELGVEPGPELQQLHERMLHNDPELAASLAPESAVAARPAVPAQLPLVPRGFTGRSSELEQLQGFLTTRDGEDPVTVIILTGTAGVGKTATALYWGQRIAHRFPDGQLYANLRGFDPSSSAVEASDALRGFLGALGVSPEGFPATVEAQAALFRSLLSRRRMLILLDNVFDAAHVRPLLPGAGQSLALVTSRNPLTGLVAAEGAQPLVLNLLSENESWHLLAVRLGRERLTAEPEATRRLISGCAGLPLALAVMAARVQVQPQATLAAIATDLGTAPPNLDALSDEDPLVDVRAVFSWSYGALTPPAALVFRLCALHPGPEVALETVEDLAQLPAPQAAAALDELVEAQLFAEAAPGRFGMHDLLRAYATELVAKVETQSARTAARARLRDHYLHTAHGAALVLHNARLPIPMPPRHADLHGVELASPDEARSWFTAEFSALCATMRMAAETGAPGHVWRIAWAISDFTVRQSRWKELEAINLAALAAALDSDDAHGCASAYRFLSVASHFQGRLADAEHYNERGRQVCLRAGLVAEQALLHLEAGSYLEVPDPAQGLRHNREALELSRQCGYTAGIANALNGIATYCANAGDYATALGLCEEALVRFRELDNPYGTAAVHGTFGHVRYRLGHLTEAVDAFEEAIALYRKVGRLAYVADNLVWVGDVYRDAGQPEEAGRAWHEALAIYRDLGQVDEELVDRIRKLPKGVDRY